MAKNVVLGVDFGSCSVVSVIAGWENGKGMRVLGLGTAASEGVRRGQIIDVEAAARSLRSSLDIAEKKANLRMNSGFFTIGGIGLGAARAKGAVAVSRANNEISEHDVRRALDACQSNLEPMANREILHSIPLTFTVDGNLSSLNPVGMSGIRLECESFFITAINKDVRNIVRTAELAGLTVEDVVAAPMAAARAVLSKRHKEVGCMLMDLGAATSTLIIFEEGSPISLEVLPFGSGSITNDLAIGFKISLDEAEEMKKSFLASATAKKQLVEIISARLSDIFELTNKHLKRIDRLRLLPAGVVLTGGGSAFSDLAVFAKDYLGLPAQTGSLEEIVLPDGMTGGQWSAAIGLCLMVFDSIKGRPEIGFELTRKTGNILLRWLKSLLP
ncbi:MAG: cell division protein FtsA [Patescibacteria group bacterium]